MIRKIKKWLHSKLFIFPDEAVQAITVIQPMEPTHQCNTRDFATRKRVKAAFEAQALEMNARAMVPHDPSCKDPITCKKKKCFKWKPGIIVSEPIVIEVKKR